MKITIARDKFWKPDGAAISENYSGSQADFSTIVTEIRRRAKEPYYVGEETFNSIRNALYTTIQTRGIDNFHVAYPGSTCYIHTTSALYKQLYISFLFGANWFESNPVNGIELQTVLYSR